MAIRYCVAATRGGARFAACTKRAGNNEANRQIRQSGGSLSIGHWLPQQNLSLPWNRTIACIPSIIAFVETGRQSEAHRLELFQIQPQKRRLESARIRE